MTYYSIIRSLKNIKLNEPTFVKKRKRLGLKQCAPKNGLTIKYIMLYLNWGLKTCNRNLFRMIPLLNR